MFRNAFGCAKTGPTQWIRRWAQVAEWLMAADCKSAVLWDYEGSNPSLCTSTLGLAVDGWLMDGSKR